MRCFAGLSSVKDCVVTISVWWWNREESCSLNSVVATVEQNNFSYRTNLTYKYTLQIAMHHNLTLITFLPRCYRQPHSMVSMCLSSSSIILEAGAAAIPQLGRKCRQKMSSLLIRRASCLEQSLTRSVPHDVTQSVQCKYADADAAAICAASAMVNWWHRRNLTSSKQQGSVCLSQDYMTAWRLPTVRARAYWGRFASGPIWIWRRHVRWARDRWLQSDAFGTN